MTIPFTLVSYQLVLVRHLHHADDIAVSSTCLDRYDAFAAPLDLPVVNIDWLGGRLHTPAEDRAQLLDLMEVPQEAIWMEGESRNTYENAAFSKRILQENNIRSIVLVTSAAHMPRSVMLFEEQGLDIIPAPTEFSVTEADWDQLIHANWAARWMDWIPSAANLSQTTSALKEILGIAIYSLRARIFD